MGLKTSIQSSEEWLDGESKDQKIPSTRSEFSALPNRTVVVWVFLFIFKSHPKQAASMYVFFWH